MIRRTAILGFAAFAVTAGSALAATTWHTQMTDGSATAARTASKCAFSAGSQAGTLRVTCKTGGRATLKYVFTSSRAVVGTPSSSVDAAATGSTVATSAAKAAGETLTVTVRVAGAGSVVISSVSVGYYTR